MNASYHDSAQPVPLDAAAIRRHLGALADAFEILCLDRCDSTNTYVLQATAPQDGRASLVVAEHQLAGRGRLGRSWQAWPGSSLTFSLRWPFTQVPHFPAGLSLAVGLAIAQTLERLGIAGVALKWPNDVLILGQKVGGVLIELLTPRSQPPAAVIGIGLNIQLPAEARDLASYPVTDLGSQLGSPPDRNALLAQLLTALDQILGQYTYNGFACLRDAWMTRNAFAAMPVRIVDAGRTVLEGVCQGVDADGALLIETGEGVERILSGDLSLRAGDTA